MKTKITKRLMTALLALVMLCSLALPALGEGENDSERWTGKLKIAVMSDVHYLSPDMIADTEDYTTALNSDRKIYAEGDAINDAMLDAVRADKPDVLLITGDLSKDGELECHKALAAKLKALLEELPDMKIYLINGNHDIRNENGLNFATADGKAVPATRTNPEDFKQAYDFVYGDESVIATFTPAEGTEAGGLSYVARPCEGYTFVVIDTCCYSADNTSDGEDEHETRGAINEALTEWVTEQTKAAKERGDVVIGASHHGLVPHFSMEPEIMSSYLIDDYDSIGAQWADAGMSVIFTGHMHANDISAMTTKNGNTIYDIETGSALTYPCGMRFVELRECDGDLLMNVGSTSHFGPISYTDPVSGKAETIADVTEYARERGFSADMLCTVIDVYLGGALNDLNIADSATVKWLNGKIIANLQGIVRDGVAIPITEDKTLLDVVNYLYQSHLGGEDDGNYPEYVNVGLEKVKSGEVLDELLRIVKTHAFGTIGEQIRFDSIFTDIVKDQINKLILKIANSFGNDVNYTEDLNTLIMLSGDSSRISRLPAGDTAANVYTRDGVSTLFVYESVDKARIDLSELGSNGVELWGRSAAKLGTLDVKLASGTVYDLELGESKDVCAEIEVGGEADYNAAQLRALGQKDHFIVRAIITENGEPAVRELKLAVPYKLYDEIDSLDIATWNISETGVISAKANVYDSQNGMLCLMAGSEATVVTTFPYQDVPASEWCYSDIAYVTNNELFSGTGAKAFSPYGMMTRAQFVSVIYRMEGAPDTTGLSAPFEDVSEDYWAYDAIVWGYNNGVIMGYSDAEFAPAGHVTRAQFVAMLYRYYGEPEVKSANTDFTDADSIPAYARSAAAWAVENGIVLGYDDGTFRPMLDTSRAQMAAIMHRFIESKY